MQPGAQLLGLIGYRTNVVRLNQELLESDAGTTHLMGLGLRKGTNIGALMLLCGVHFSAGDFPPEIGPFACDPKSQPWQHLVCYRGHVQGKVSSHAHTKADWLDYDPVALAVLVIGMIGLLALTI